MCVRRLHVQKSCALQLRTHRIEKFIDEIYNQLKTNKNERLFMTNIKWCCFYALSCICKQWTIINPKAICLGDNPICLSYFLPSKYTHMLFAHVKDNRASSDNSWKKVVLNASLGFSNYWNEKDKKIIGWIRHNDYVISTTLWGWMKCRHSLQMADGQVHFFFKLQIGRYCY